MDNRLFITTHNTDFTELRGWQQPDGIWTTELLALGGMVRGAYQLGQGVDVRTMRVDDGSIDVNGLPGRVTVGAYRDALGAAQTGFIPENIDRATVEQTAELRELEKVLRRDFAAENREQWRTALALAQQNHRPRTGEDGFVWMVLAPAERTIGISSYTRHTFVIAGLFTDESTARAELARRQLTDARGTSLTLVSVPLNSSFDVDKLGHTAGIVAEMVKAGGRANLESRYAELRKELGL